VTFWTQKRGRSMNDEAIKGILLVAQEVKSEISPNGEPSQVLRTIILRGLTND
jgi:hypothetical protein